MSTNDKITIRHQFFGGSGLCHIVCLNDKDMATLSNGDPKDKPLLALVIKYKDKEQVPATVVSALRRYKESWGKNINPKLPFAPLSHEQICISSRCEETGWDYVVITITTQYPNGDRWQQTLRSPHYTNSEWDTVCHFIKKRRISGTEFSRLKQIACKEEGPFEIVMTPYDHHGWRGKSA